MDYILGRPKLLNTVLVWACYIFIGLLTLLNIHFSATAIIEQGISNGVVGISVIEVILSSYVPATFVTLFCTTAFGFIFYPSAIPLVLNQMHTIQSQAKTIVSKAFAFGITGVILGGIIYSLFKCYQYDIYTTQLYMGTQSIPLMDFRQLPMWSFIAGPEILTVVAHALGYMNGIGGGRAPAKMRSANPVPVNASPGKQQGGHTSGTPWDKFMG